MSKQVTEALAAMSWDIDEDREHSLIFVGVTSAPSEFELTKIKLGLKQQMGVLRRLTGSARILFDLTDYPGSSDEAIARFQHVDGEFVQDDDDRFALVVPRSIDKVTARKMLHSPNSELFLSANAAKSWLTR